MTKEEIIDKHHNLNLGLLSITEKQIHSAMDEYAQQEAVAVLEWYDKLSPAEKCTVWPPAGSGGSFGIYTLSYKQLYQLYLKHKKQ